MNVASGASGRSASVGWVCNPPISDFVGCTGQTGPSNPILRHCSITFSAQPAPSTAMWRGRSRRSRRVMPGLALLHRPRGAAPDPGIFVDEE